MKMGVVRVRRSALRGGLPATISYRSMGAGEPVVLFLHGGWGYDTYPIDTAVAGLASCHLVLIPDRSGHGRSTPVDALPLDFHRLAMLEMTSFLDKLGIDRAVWWGHSDGAVIAARAAIEHPDRVDAVILEGLHLFKNKPGSRVFFEQMAWAPAAFGPAVEATLRIDHGERWQEVLRLDGEAWLGLAASADPPDADLYDGRLGEIAVPTLLIHGGRDPRSEPGEFDHVRAALATAAVHYDPDAGHSPHSQPRAADGVAEAVRRFVEELRPHQRPKDQQRGDRRGQGGNEDAPAHPRELST